MEQQQNNSNSLESVCKDPAALQLQIYDWMVRGESEATIIAALQQHLTQEQIRDLIAKVYTRFFDLMRADPQSVYGWTLAAAQDVYKKMYSIGDFAGCLKAIKEIRAIAEKMNPAKPEGGPSLSDGKSVPEADINEIPALDLNA